MSRLKFLNTCSSTATLLQSDRDLPKKVENDMIWRFECDLFATLKSQHIDEILRRRTHSQPRGIVSQIGLAIRTDASDMNLRQTSMTGSGDWAVGSRGIFGPRGCCEEVYHVPCEVIEK